MVGSLDEDAAFEAGSGADEGDEVGCDDGSPPAPGGLDELGVVETHNGQGLSHIRSFVTRGCVVSGAFCFRRSTGWLVVAELVVGMCVSL